MTQDEILGAWSLRDWIIEYPQGRLTHPFGPDPCGLIVYTPDGWMSAVLMRRERTPFATHDMRLVQTHARARAFDEYLSYAGRWRLEGSVVEHEVEFSLNPLLIGTTQIRAARLADNELTLTATEPLAFSGIIRQHTISWLRPG